MPTEAPLLFAGARIQSVPGGSEAEAMAVREGRVLAVGTLEEARAAAGVAARTVDLGGGLVRPGFHDAHTHLSAGAVEAFARVDLRGAPDARSAAEKAAAHARGLPLGAWLRGFGWDHTRWPGSSWPTRAELDDALPRRPAFLVRLDGHAAWLNGAGLAAAGVPAQGPPGGSERVPRDRDGRPTGILLEEAMEVARRALPEDDAALRRTALLRVLREAAAVGIAAIEDVAEPWAPELYSTLAVEGRLTARIGVWLPGELDEGRAKALASLHPKGDPWISVSTRKLFLDGTLGSRSAALLAPYADAPEASGLLRFEDAELKARVAALSEDGWAIALHAIGDAAVRQAASVLATAAPHARHRIEHLQVVAHDTLPELARSRAGASVQPVHFSEDSGWIGARLGAREVLAYPWRSLLRAGIPLAFGTDWPIAPLDPRLGLSAAVGRSGEGLLEHEAWSAYTRGSAAVSGWEAPRGTLRPGAFADFVVLGADPATLDAGALEDLPVRATWVGGKRMHPGEA